MPCAKSNFQSLVDWLAKIPPDGQVPIVSVSAEMKQGGDPLPFNLSFVGMLTFVQLSPSPISYLYGTVMTLGGPEPIPLGGDIPVQPFSETLAIAMTDPVQVFWGTDVIQNTECFALAEGNLRVTGDTANNRFEILLSKQTVKTQLA
jgi:hypothetical protein